MSNRRYWDTSKTLHGLYVHDLIRRSLERSAPNRHSVEGRAGREMIVRYSTVHNIFMRIRKRHSVFDWDREQIIR